MIDGPVHTFRNADETYFIDSTLLSKLKLLGKNEIVDKFNKNEFPSEFWEAINGKRDLFTIEHCKNHYYTVYISL
jgi:hypothetical protein